MGYAKRLLAEEDARRYHQSNDSICADCFHDPGIKWFIKNNLSATECSICHKRADTEIAVSANLLLEYILDKIDSAYESADAYAPFDPETHEYVVCTWDL